MVILQTFDNYVSATILQSRLDQCGIKAYMLDEHTVTIGPFLGGAIGNIKLVVADKDAPSAIKLLDFFRREQVQINKCPRCLLGNLELVPRRSFSNFFTAILTWLFSNYAVSEKVYHCDCCGYETTELPDTSVMNN